MRTVPTAGNGRFVVLTARHIAAIGFAVILPIALFGAGVAFFIGTNDQNEIEEQIGHEAQEAATDVDRMVMHNLALLGTLALALDRDDLVLTRRLLRRALDANRSWLAIARIDPGSDAIEEHVVEGARYGPFLKMDLVREVLRTGTAQVNSSLSTERDSGILAISVPIMRDSLTRGALSLVLPTKGFVAALIKHTSRQTPRFLMLDASNRVVSCASVSGDCSTAVGMAAELSLVNGLARPERGFFQARLAGELCWTMGVPAPVSGWTVVAGVPLALLQDKQADRHIAIIVSGLAVGAVGFIVMVLLIHAILGRDVAERRLVLLESERESERRLSNIARSLPGVGFRRIRTVDGWVHMRCIADGDNVFHLPVSSGGDESAVGEALLRMMTSDTLRRWEDLFERSAAALTPLQIEGELTDPTGRLHGFRANANVRQRSDGTVIWDGVILDITDLHEAELARRLSADQLAFALECADAGIWEWDIVSNRCTWSDSFWRLMGYTEPMGEPTLEKLEQRLHPDDIDVFWAGIDTVLAQGEYTASEYRFLQPDGSMRWVTSRARTTVDMHGMPVRISGLDIDITRLKRFQEELRTAKDEAERANDAKSRFLAAASHDLRQPVQAMMLFVDILRQKLVGYPQEALVGDVQKSIDALRELLDGILDLSQLDAGVVEIHSVDVPAAAVLTRIANEYSQRFALKNLSLRVRPSTAMVNADPMQVGRILGNLVENALKYTERGGVLVAARRRGERLRFEVWDTGIGIPADRVGEIFGEFVQLGNPERDRQNGLGLGLAIVRRLTLRLGYPVTVLSRPGRGSLFAFSVPLATADPALPGDCPVIEHTAPPPGPMAVPAVVIDDDPILVEGLRAMMEDWGCSVIAAPNLAQALAAIERDGVTPGFAIVDYRLGKSENGLDALLTLRGRFGDTLCGVLLSGDSRSDDVAHRPGLRFAQKPVTPERLHALFVELTGAAQAATNSSAR